MAIPGLSVCPNVGNGSIVELQSFAGSISIKESHRFGHCRLLNDFPLVGNSHIEGHYGVVYKCQERSTNQIFALKLFKMPENYENGIPVSVLREIYLLRSLKHHSNIINSHGTVAGKELDRNYLILDYCEFTLKDLYERNFEAIFDRAMIKYVMDQILQGLDFIHLGLIIHRDICSKNIMMTKKGIVKIGGFRTSRFFNKGNMTPGMTELNYRAPELIFSNEYGPAIDMWSVGCIFAELLLKRPLFSGNSELELLKSIFCVLGTPTEKTWPGFAELFSKLGIDEGRIYSVTNEIQFNCLNEYFANENVACRNLVQDILVYCPNARFQAQMCLDSLYFKEKASRATAEDLERVLQSLIPEM